MSATLGKLEFVVPEFDVELLCRSGLRERIEVAAADVAWVEAKVHYSIKQGPYMHDSVYVVVGPVVVRLKAWRPPSGRRVWVISSDSAAGAALACLRTLGDYVDRDLVTVDDLAEAAAC